MDNGKKTIIEINGAKLEVDLRTATRVDTLRVGDRVRLLLKPSYGEATVHSGTIIGFEPFPSLPTVIVAYLKQTYSDAALEFAYVNANSKGTELVASSDDDSLALAKEDILIKMDAEIAKRETAFDEAKRRKDFFLRHFAVYWRDAATIEAATVE